MARGRYGDRRARGPRSEHERAVDLDESLRGRAGARGGSGRHGCGADRELAAGHPARALVIRDAR